MALTPGTSVRFGFEPTFEKELKASPEYKHALAEKAEEAADFARAFAPGPGVGEKRGPDRSTGDYRASIHVAVDADGVRLVADDYKAIWVEFGTGLDGGRPQGGWSPVFAPLRRGIRAAGMELGGETELFKSVQVRPHLRGGRLVRGHFRHRPFNA